MRIETIRVQRQKIENFNSFNFSIGAVVPIERWVRCMRASKVVCVSNKCENKNAKLSSELIYLCSFILMDVRDV